ncbi:MAG: CPBP family intramembrane metalloprotease [Clostridiales bacterium]|nr:CPBP family intramembrane metalloprotease [Clostridiales bacterium]
MAENNIEDIKTASDKRTVRKGYIFLSFIPFAIIMAVQTATTTPGIIMAMLEMQKQGLPNELSKLMEIFNEKYAAGAYVAYCVICIAVFIPWYYKGFVKKGTKTAYKKALGIKPIVLSISLLICLYLIISGLFILAERLVPDVMSKYAQLMEFSSLGSNMIITILYGYLLGPVTEELCFRGLMYSMLEKSKMHYLLVIFIQGLLFGVMHMNVVQSTYAFLLGIALGYIRYKYKTIFLSVGAHIVFNVFGTSVELFLEGAGITDTQKIILGVIGAALAAAVLVVMLKDKNSYTKEGEDLMTASRLPSDAS